MRKRNKNPLVKKIKEKFGWTIPTYAERRGIEEHNLKRFVYGGTNGRLIGSKAMDIKEILIKDGIIDENLY